MTVLKQREDGLVFLTTPELKDFSPDAHTAAEKLETCFRPGRDEEFCKEEDMWQRVMAPYFKALEEGFRSFE
jgi:hypothetical protein